ncbi:MAG: YceD family protein [Gammaproteobacteria bacterium]|nr:YceD family protein [Gammaproteobacteria bacterium]
MHHKLPKEIEPFRLAQNGLTLEGQLPLSSMPRLTELLQSNEGIVDVKMAFDVDHVGTPFMHGEFKTSVSLICERCMAPMILDMKVDCLLAIVISERKIEGLAEQYEPWVLDNNDPVLLSTVVEDELILSLPLVPRHDEACLPDELWSTGDDFEESEKDKPVSPFAVLTDLKTKQ